MSDQQILDRGREATENGCTEMHIVGGLHHQKPYEWYRHLIELLHEQLSADPLERLDGGRDQLV